MKKPIDKAYLENCFKTFHTYLVSKTFHTHENKTVLDKISESTSGNMLFNGKELNSGDGSGIKGENGKSAYQLAVDNGFNGSETEWLASLKGEKGTQGNKGDPGQNGITPHIDPTTKHWFIGNVDTGVVAEGIKGDKGDQGANAENVTLETLGAASVDHVHGYLKTVTLSTTEPESVEEGEIVMVYETEET